MRLKLFFWDFDDDHNIQLLEKAMLFTERTSTMSHNNDNWKLQSPYRQDFGVDEDNQTPATSDSAANTNTTSVLCTYSAQCYCGRVRYEVTGEPEISKNCHCRGCQQLHGAPYEWVRSERKGIDT